MMLFESRKLSKGIGAFVMRGPEHVEVRHEGRVVEGRKREFERMVGGKVGEHAV